MSGSTKGCCPCLRLPEKTRHRNFNSISGIIEVRRGFRHNCFLQIICLCHSASRGLAGATSKLMAKEIDPLKLSSPRIFLFRMLVFVVLVGLIAFVLHKQIQVAFMSNPGLNALIIGVLAIGIVLSARQVLRLYPEIAWVNNFRLADPGLAVDRPPVLLAPMAAILGSRVGRMAMSSQLMRGILDSIATRLDEARDISRYMTGLLVFLGLLGTFWGLIETVSSVGNVIQGLKASGDTGTMFDSLRDGLAAPLSGMYSSPLAMYFFRRVSASPHATTAAQMATTITRLRLVRIDFGPI